MPPAQDDRWYQDAIIYAVDVETFQDGDGDGSGDFAGLISQLDYLADLGVDCLWLLPFYPSPNRDNGYDITDYLTASDTFGGLAGFTALRHAATACGIRLVTDLVVQHTSDEHPWFRASRAGDPAYRDYYVWTADPPPRSPAKPIFPGVEESVWAWDDVRAAWYLHQFYRFEPDLNVESDAVMDEIRAIVARWLDLGADGFRIDAASMAFGNEALQPEPVDQPYRFMRALRASVDAHPRGGVLIGEGAIVPERLEEYFGGDDGLQMLFTFGLTANIFLALAREDGEPIARALEHLPTPPQGGQWVTFLRNLDELNLDQLAEDEREEVFRAFAPDPAMRVYGRGIRRRLAPMLGDRRRIELAFSLLLTMPGTPIIVSGDEIGMGDDLDLPERESVRTVMQWSNAPNGGFSTAAAAALTRPAISGGPFGYERVNVAAQRDDPASMLNWLRRAIAARKQHAAFGRGSCRVVPTGDRRVLALCASWRGRETVAVHNLSATPCTVTLDLGARRPAPPRDGFSDQAYPPPRDNRVELGPFGFRWLDEGLATPEHPNRAGAES